MSQLKIGLELILGTVMVLSLFLLSLSEKKLSSLNKVTHLVKEIKRRGLKKEDKAKLPDVSLSRSDEVSELSREFQHMASALLEREKTVEQQKSRLQEQNVTLREMMSQQARMQKRLRLAENLAAVGQMSAQVAHEIRNPLHSIGLEAEIAIEASETSNHLHLKQSLHSILESVDRLEKITENYLRLSRISSGEKRPIDMGSIFERVLATYAPNCEKIGVQVEWRRQKDANLKVHGDEDLLEQVLGNLFKNALQAVENVANPKVEWSIGNVGDSEVRIRIMDNGAGVPDPVKSKIFTPFVTTKAQGTGLGLSFVRKVIDDHHGKVSLISSNQGACFEVVLPVVECDLKEEDNGKQENQKHLTC